MSSNNHSTAIKIIILPGNGCVPIRKCNWYQSVHDSLVKMGVRVMMKDMPDPVLARENIWIPFTREVLGCDERTIIVGHSSGAECAMRYMEQYKVLGAVLVSPYITDLGSEIEAQSGYFDRPWLWDKMKENSEFVMQFSSHDDHLVPYDEQEQVHKSLRTELHEYHNEGHFLFDTFPDLTKAIMKKIKEIEGKE